MARPHTKRVPRSGRASSSPRTVVPVCTPIPEPRNSPEHRVDLDWLFQADSASELNGVLHYPGRRRLRSPMLCLKLSDRQPPMRRPLAAQASSTRSAPATTASVTNPPSLQLAPTFVVVCNRDPRLRRPHHDCRQTPQPPISSPLPDPTASRPSCSSTPGPRRCVNAPCNRRRRHHLDARLRARLDRADGWLRGRHVAVTSAPWSELCSSCWRSS